MRGKECYAVMYSEYSGDLELDEPDRCLIDKVTKESRKNWSVSTVVGDIKEISVLHPNLISKAIYKKYKNEGEINLLKIIVKNKETGEQKCIDIPKERENDSDIKALKVGMTVSYFQKLGCLSELAEVVKIVDDRPPTKTPPYAFKPYLRQSACAELQYPRRAYKTSFSQEFWEDIRKMKEENKARKEYREKPYFNVRLDTMKGNSDGKENLEKIKFPCWCVFKYQKEDWTQHLGMLVTGFPNTAIEYQLIDMGHQSGVKDCCTVERELSLGILIDKYSIEVIKGESRCFKMGQFNI